MIRVFAFGGGVQSMAGMVLTAQRRLHYDAFVFAHVGEDSERPGTLRYIQCYARLYADDHDINLVEVRKTTRKSPKTLYQYLMDDNRSVSIPMRLSNGAPGKRNCTTDWKIEPIAKWLKKQGATPNHPAVVALGISVDESHRARTDSGIAWETLEYPLLDLRLTRSACAQIITDAGLPVPPKSACWFCPYKRMREWQDMRRLTPDTFQRACALEERLNVKRNAMGRDVVRFHRSLKPLADAVDDSQLAWDDELEMCEAGYCGI